MGDASYIAEPQDWPPKVQPAFVCTVKSYYSMEDGFSCTYSLITTLTCTEIRKEFGHAGSIATIKRDFARFGQASDEILSGGERIAIFSESPTGDPDEDNPHLIFTGRIWQRIEDYGPNSDDIVYLAKDYSFDLEKMQIWGQVMRHNLEAPPSFSQRFEHVESLQTIFNPKGRFNKNCASYGEASWNHTSIGDFFLDEAFPVARPFSYSNTAENWSLQSMLDYCLVFGFCFFLPKLFEIGAWSAEWVAVINVFVFSTSKIKTMFENVICDDVNVNGMTVAEALTHICGLVQCDWHVEPRDPIHCELVITKKDYNVEESENVLVPGTKSHSVYIPNVYPGASPWDDHDDYAAKWGIQSISSVQSLLNANKITLDTNWSTLVNYISVKGAPKKYEPLETEGGEPTYITLTAGWSKTEENSAFGVGVLINPDRQQQDSLFLQVTGNPDLPEFVLGQNVGRRFIVNENGDLAGDFPEQTQYDYSSMLYFDDPTTANYTLRPRPFHNKRISRDSLTKNKESIIVQRKAPDSDEWEEVSDFEILPDMGGIYITGETPMYKPSESIVIDEYSKANGFYNIRVIAAIDGDWVPSSCAESTLNPKTGEPLGEDQYPSFWAEKVFIYDNEYETDNVNPSEVQQQSLQDLAEEKLKQFERRQEKASITIEFITYKYELGGMLTEIIGRNRYDLMQDWKKVMESDKKIPILSYIVGIIWNFETQSTELILEDFRMQRTTINQKLLPGGGISPYTAKIAPYTGPTLAIGTLAKP